MTSQTKRTVRQAGDIVTRATHLLGAVIVANETLVRAELRPAALAMAALLLAGVQGLDSLLDRLIGKPETQ